MENILVPNTEKLNSLVDDTETSSKYFCEVYNRIMNEYIEGLDNLMIQIHRDVVAQTPNDEMLEKYSLELSNTLYFVGNSLEQIGIRDDVSKISNKEKYNETYLNMLQTPGVKRTVAELTAASEEESKYNTIINNIYSRAYKQIKFKVDAGYEMLSTIKKLISKRMQENQIQMQNTDSLVTGEL